MPTAKFTRRWDYNRLDMTAEQYAEKHGFVTDFGKRVLAASLQVHHQRRLQILAQAEYDRTMRRAVEEEIKRQELLSRPVTPPQVPPPTVAASPSTPKMVSPSLPVTETSVLSSSNSSPSNGFTGPKAEVPGKYTRNSDRLSARKREGFEFTVEVRADQELCKQIMHLIQPSMDCRIGHLPVYVSTTNFPERLSSKATLSNLFRYLPTDKMAEVQVTASHQRLDITAARASSNPIPKKSVPAVITQFATKTPESTPSPARKFEILMERKGQKRSLSATSVENLAVDSCPESQPEPAVIPAKNILVEPGTGKSNGPNKKAKAVGAKTRASRRRAVADHDGPPGKQLYAFILELLAAGQTDVVAWTHRTVGEFRIKDSTKVARLWGEHRGNSKMSYDKMARALRYYYEGADPILFSVTGRSLTYRFAHTPDNRIQGYSWTDLTKPGVIKRIVTSPHRPHSSKSPSESSSSTSGSDDY